LRYLVELTGIADVARERLPSAARSSQAVANPVTMIGDV